MSYWLCLRIDEAVNERVDPNRVTSLWSGTNKMTLLLLLKPPVRYQWQYNEEIYFFKKRTIESATLMNQKTLMFLALK